MRNPELKRVKSHSKIKIKDGDKDREVSKDEIDYAYKTFSNIISLLYSIFSNTSSPTRTEYLQSPAVYYESINILGFQKEQIMKSLIGM